VVFALAAAGAFLSGPGLLPATGQERSSGGASPLRPVGTVFDLQSGAPVSVARVMLLDSASLARIALAETDSTGSFVLPPVPRGPYVVRVERIGYKTTEDSLTLQTPEDAEVTVFMVPEAVDLDPIVVTAARTAAYYLRDFERRRTTGSGTFITHTDIQRANSNSTSEMLQRLGRVRVVRGTRGEANLFMRGTCRPQVYVDGALLHNSVSIDSATLPEDIAAVEIYSDAGIPIQYAIKSPCGVILVWTHPAVKTEGEKVAVWKWIFAGSLAAVLLLLAR
jgi:hypothetical protein